MSKIIFCLDCPMYQKGGTCARTHKDVGALQSACEHSQTINQIFNPEDTPPDMKTLSAKDYDVELAEPETKHCPRCGRDLPLDAFGKKKSAKDGLQHWCKECTNASVIAARKAKKAGQTKETTKPKAESKPKAAPVVVREKMTAKQMVDALRAEGWTVTCTRTITEEL